MHKNNTCCQFRILNLGVQNMNIKYFFNFKIQTQNKLTKQNSDPSLSLSLSKLLLQAC